MRAGGVVQTRKTRHESRANQHDELEKEEEDFHLLLQWLFPPCVSFLSFHYETQKQSRSKKEGRERERTALSALANANFLFPARLQWDTPRLLLFRQSTTLSLNSAIIIESLLFFNSNIHFDTFLSFPKII